MTNTSIHTSTRGVTSRRHALGFTAAALVAGLTTQTLAKGQGSTRVTDPDAVLLRLCVAFFEAHAAWYARADEFSDAWDAAGERRNAVSQRLALIAAQTDAGRIAKAKVAFALAHEEEPNPDRMDHVQLVVYSTLRDIAGRIGA